MEKTGSISLDSAAYEILLILCQTAAPPKKYLLSMHLGY